MNIIRYTIGALRIQPSLFLHQLKPASKSLCISSDDSPPFVNTRTAHEREETPQRAQEEREHVLLRSKMRMRTLSSAIRGLFLRQRTYMPLLVWLAEQNRASAC